MILTGTYANLSKDPENWELSGFNLGGDGHGVGPGKRGFSLGESEITFSANVDSLAYGALTLGLDGDNEVEVEEAFVQTTSLPAGLRLALLWLVPTRRWGWLGAAEIAAQATKSMVLGYPLFSMTFVGVCIAPWVIYASVVFVARGPQAGQALDTPTRMLGFLLAGLVGAAGVSPLLWLFLVTVPMSAVDSIASMFTFMYGDMIGQLVLAPVLVALAHGRMKPRRRAFWRDMGVVLVGAVIQALVQGGLLSVSVTMLQLVLAVVGAGALVLGAASAALRHSHEELAARQPQEQWLARADWRAFDYHARLQG